jgi:acyl-CoA synthetase (AMP-forming)/AMP-acid ligase II
MNVTTAADVIRYHAQERPDKTAIYFQGTESTYGELNRQSNRVANGILAEGLAPQTRIAILDKNSDIFFELMYGAAKTNCVTVAINWRLAPPEIAYVINDAKAELLFVGPDFFGHVEKIQDQIPTVKKIFTLSGSHEGWASAGDWLNSFPDSDVDVPLGDDDVVLQMYTSGTTGNPKGAQLTNSNLTGLLSSGVDELGIWSADDVNLVCMPLYHIGGTGVALLGFWIGAKNVVVREFNPVELLKVMPEQKVSKTFFVPAVLLFLMQTPGCLETDFSNLQLVLYGASPMPLELLRKSMAVFKCQFAQVYGLTETTGAITYLPPEDHDPNGNERMKSCGKPFSSVEIRIVDEQGTALPPREVGEIITRSKQNMKGYWNLPDATARAIKGEWFHTGDAGYTDEEGYVYIYDRVKDMIVSGGENIYPAEVESAIFGHPAVADVAVIGVPDEKWGESVKAVIVKKPGAEATEDEIIAYSREKIASYKVPRSVDFVEALPRNPTGKILKRELRAPYWEGRERQVN